MPELHLCKDCNKFMGKNNYVTKDIELVCAQVNASPGEALGALIKNNGDIVDAIMELQLWNK